MFRYTVYRFDDEDASNSLFCMRFNLLQYIIIITINGDLKRDIHTLRVILNMLLVIDSLPAFGTSKYEYREYTNIFFLI